MSQGLVITWGSDMKKILKRVARVVVNWCLVATLPLWAIPVLVWQLKKDEVLVRFFLTGDEKLF